MKSALKKDFFREIRRNFGRFISIFFIVLLGAAFYSGIRSANYDMKYSADHYFDESGLMDIRVLSTLGLTEEDLEDMRQVEGVENAAGGYTQDVLCDAGEAELTLQVIALTEDVNRVTLQEGRMPENDRECVADVLAMTELGYEIGDTLTLRSGTEDPLSDSLKYDTYTIVGSGSLPYYLDLSRGESTVGDGTQDAFILVEPEVFSLDVYTEAYIQVRGAQEALSYSDAYKAQVEPVLDRLEEISGGACQRRYDSLKTEAETELSDARQQVEEAETELSDAREEIQEGWQELSEAEDLLREKEQEVQEGEAELASGEAELSDARAQLEEGEARYREGEAALYENQAALEEAWAQLEEGWAQLESGEALLVQNSGELSEARAQYQAGEASYQAGLQSFQEQKAQYEAGAVAYEEENAKYQAGLQAYQQGAEEYAARQQEFQAGWDAFVSQAGEPETVLEQFDRLDARKIQMEEALEAAGINPEESPEYQQLLEQWKLLQTAAETARQLLEGKEELEAAAQQLEETKAQLDQAGPALEEVKAQLEAAVPALEAGQAELEAAKAQLEEAAAQIASGEQQLAAGWQELEESEAQLQAAEAQAASGEQELAAGWQELLESQPELESARAQIAQGEAELSEARTQLEEGKRQIQEGWQEIEENRQTLTEAEKEYEEAYAEAQPELQDAREQIAEGEKALADLEVPEWYVLDRGMISSTAGYEQDAQRIKNLGEVFPVIFFLVAALVSLTAMTRMVEEQRIQIGTLKALGYSDGAIALKYFSYAMLATVTGAVLGIWIGQKALPYVIMDAYGMMYIGFSEYFTPINWDQAAMALGASAASTGIATLAACLRELKARPAELMRPEAPKNGRRILLERIRFIWKHLSFNRKSTFRNLFRYKKRFFMTIIGIGGCMALMLVGFGIQDSIADMARRQYVDIFTYDASVTLNESASQEERREFLDYAEERRGVTAAMELFQKSVELENKGETMDAYLYVPEDREQVSDFVRLQNRVSREEYQYPAAGAAVSEKTAKMLGLSLGDTVTVELEGETAQIEIVEIVENYVMHYLFISPEQYQASFGREPSWNQLELNYEDNSPAAEQQIGNDLMSYEACTGISFVTDLEQEISDMLRSLNVVIYVLIIAAGLLAFVVLYNLNNINITERRRELATLKVLGFYDSEVAMYVYRENIILTVIGIAAGALMGTFLHQYTIQTVEVDMMMFGRQISVLSYFLSSAITLVFSVLVNLVMYRSLKKIDMIESLKSVE